MVIIKKVISALLVVLLAMALLPAVSQAESPDAADFLAQIHEVKPYEAVEPANTYLVYQPDVTLNGSTSPIIAILGNEAFTRETAAQAIEDLRLDELCQRVQSYAVFINPDGTTWAPSDVSKYQEAINLFGEVLLFRYDGLFPHAQFISNQNIIYCFAEGAGADFVSQHLIKSEELKVTFASIRTPTFRFYFNHIPSSVFLCNPTADGAGIDLNGTGIAAVVVNGSSELVDALVAENEADESKDVFGGKAYYNSEAPHRKIVSVNGSANGFDGSVFAGNLDTLVTVRRERMGMDFMLTGSLDWDAMDIDEYRLSFATGPGNTVRYQVYIPRNIDTGIPDSVPMVLSFHGGGETADLNVKSTLYPLLGKEKGFITISVDQHFTTGSVLDDTNIDIFMSKIFADYPFIDRGRVYASGMSLGAVKTWLLGFHATEYFAAIAPFNGVTTGLNPDGDIIPAFYVAGRSSPLVELPRPESAKNNANELLRLLLKRNLVTESYSFDESAGNVWGIQPDSTETVKFFKEYYTMHKNYFPGLNGKIHTALVDVENLGHETYPFIAREAWEFLSRFYRNQDGSVADSRLLTTSVAIGKNRASIDFDLDSANGKGYLVYVSDRADGGFLRYDNVNFNSKGVNIRGLTGGKTYYAYIVKLTAEEIIFSKTLTLRPN